MKNLFKIAVCKTILSKRAKGYCIKTITQILLLAGDLSRQLIVKFELIFEDKNWLLYLFDTY